MNTHYITCRECGTSNTPTAQRCTACGADLKSLGSPSTVRRRTSKSNVFDKFSNWINGKFGKAQDTPVVERPPQKATTWLVNSQPGQKPPVIHEIPAISPPQTAPVRQIAHNPPVAAGGSAIQPTMAGQRITDRYLVRKYTKHPTGTTIYYDAVDLVCPKCNHHHESPPQDGVCFACSTPLNAVLIHERQQQHSRQIQPAMLKNILNLGQSNHPYILYHHELLRFAQVTYSVVSHPGRWGYLVPGNRTMDEIIAIITQMGKALNFLHQQDFCLLSTSNGTEIMESWVALPGCNEVRLADMNTSLPFVPENRSAQITRDIKFLAQVLFYLSSGILSSDPDPSLAPLEFRPFIERALTNQYQSPVALMQDISGAPSSPVRQLNPSHGQATHPGRKHTVNEDAIVTFTYNKQQSSESVPVGFYLVADGMGGHDAGDLASRTVNQIVTNWVLQVQVLPDLRKTTRKLTVENIPADILKRAIAEANTGLQRHAQSRNSDLGSTVTAALLIGDTATIVNVGDSRTYRMRNNRLIQITRDHSLVARLVETNIISPEEVRSHPQRNQIYRSLGHKPEVEVDTFTVPLQRGDRLILCSDGLWEMVLDQDITRIINTARTAQEACDQLIIAANTAGGEDNISVIVMEME